MDGGARFDGVLYGISPRIRRVLEFLPERVKVQTEEIRLRAGRPVSLTVRGAPRFLHRDGQLTDCITRDLLTADAGELDESFRLLCRNSVYAHAGELKDGYIIMRSGHRAGVCGVFTEGGSLRDVSSLNIRIAREVFGCADALVREYDGGGLLIAGPPGCGKTTVLRDLIRQLSDGASGRYVRIAVIDSRGELSGSSRGECVNDLGGNTDVLMTADKAAGMQIAVRTLFPNIVAFDELGTAAELAGVAESFNAGVSVVTTAHAGDTGDLMKRSVIRELLLSGAVSKIALLPPKIGDAAKIFPVKELCGGMGA